MNRILFRTGCAFAFLGVAAGAFGAHGLKEWFGSAPELLPIWQTAVQYQMIHALGILIAAIVAGAEADRARMAGWCFIAGIVLFSGSLYTLALGGPKMLGAVTPFGGASFLTGWIFLALAPTPER